MLGENEIEHSLEVIEIERKLEQEGYKSFNKDLKDSKFYYYHNPSEPLIDLKYDFTKDEWEFFYVGKTKLKKKKKQIVSESEISITTTLKTKSLHHMFIKNSNSILEIASN